MQISLRQPHRYKYNSNYVEVLSDNLFEQHMFLKSFLEVKLATEEWKLINSVKEKWIHFFKEIVNHEGKIIKTVENTRLFICLQPMPTNVNNATVKRVFFVNVDPVD